MKQGDMRVSRHLRDLAQDIDKLLQLIAGEKMLFSLFVWSDDRSQYVSNAQRDDVKKALEECLELWKKGMPDVPLHETH